jgi:hypothetical protein
MQIAEWYESKEEEKSAPVYPLPALSVLQARKHSVSVNASSIILPSSDNSDPPSTTSASSSTNSIVPPSISFTGPTYSHSNLLIPPSELDEKSKDEERAKNDERKAVLCYHYTNAVQSGNCVPAQICKAIKYLDIVWRQSVANGALREAATHVTTAFEILADLEDNDRQSAMLCFDIFTRNQTHLPRLRGRMGSFRQSSKPDLNRVPSGGHVRQSSQPTSLSTPATPPKDSTKDED